MRTSEVSFVSVCVLTLGFLTPAFGFDGTTSESGVAPAVSVDMVSRGDVTNPSLNVPAPALAATMEATALTRLAKVSLTPGACVTKPMYVEDGHSAEHPRDPSPSSSDHIR